MRPFPPILAALLTLAACDTEAASTYSIDTLPNGAIHVLNTAPALWQDTLGWSLVLEAEHRYRADSSGALDRPNYPHLLKNGEMVVLNQVPPFVQRYAADFSPIARFGRQGSGPGEFESPAMRSFGDSLVILDGARGLLLLYDREGNWLGQHQIPNFTDRMGDPDRAGRLPLLGRYASNSDAGVMWWSVAEGRVVDSIIAPKGPPQAMIESCHLVIPFQPRLDLAPTPDGMAWYGVSDADRFVLTRTGRDTLRIVETPSRPRFPIDTTTVNTMLKPDGFMMRLCGPALNRGVFPSGRPAWGSLTVDGRNNLWVHRPASYGRAFDVYDSNGVWLGEVSSPITGDENDYWQGDVVMSVATGDNGDFILRRYRIVRD